MQRAFAQVDVFTPTPYPGNPVAVVLDGTGLSSEEMQHFAHWTNLSETTFVLPPTSPEADYRVRIFTPDARGARSPGTRRSAPATPGSRTAGGRSATT